jgi:hypothetical protein
VALHVLLEAGLQGFQQCVELFCIHVLFLDVRGTVSAYMRDGLL